MCVKIFVSDSILFNIMHWPPQLFKKKYSIWQIVKAFWENTPEK